MSDAATRGIGGSGARETLSPPLESAAEAAGGGAPASSGGTSPHSPPGEGETPRDQSQGDRRKPRERRHNPRNRRVGARESPQSSTRIRSGGGRRWSTCIKRWNVATLSPRRRGDTARPTQGDRRKPRERRRNPRNRRVGGAGKPQSSTRIRSGGGRRWSVCIKRWNVATLSPRRRGDTARPTQGDRRKPRERHHNPRSRRVGGAGKPSVLHPNPQRRRQTVEDMHQAVERLHALPQAKGRHRAAYQHTT